MPAVTNHPLPSLAPKPEPTPFLQIPVAAAAPRGRPSWSGLLRLSLVSVPIKAYAAVQTSSPSAFHLLHAHCGQRIRYAKQCPRHGPVDSDALVRGYEYASDQYVVVEPEELERLRPPRDKALILEQFVPVQEIPPTFYAGRSLYLVPDGPAAQHPYGVLVEAFGRSGRAALGRVVLSTQRQLVLVRAAGRLLVLDVLHYPAQVRSQASWEAELAPCLASEAEQDLAGQLIALASAPLDWGRYRDTSAEELAALIDAKRAQQPPAARAEEPVVLKLLDALKQSVAAACETSAVASPKTRKPRSRRAME
ncbi:MAG TPA: Ku protein [Gemmataceae bacterium]|jgi:DNA end-binding protein Ku|nr:Ku protein [Gemmataceae bacterium]